MAVKRTSSPSQRSAPTRIEFERLRADCAHLKHEVDTLRDTMRRQATDLKVQFTRIAEMQAMLDDERTAPLGSRVVMPRPLIRAHQRDS